MNNESSFVEQLSTAAGLDSAFNEDVLGSKNDSQPSSKDLNSEVLGFKYKINQKMNSDQSSGRLLIEFTSEDELSEILEKLRN